MGNIRTLQLNPQQHTELEDGYRNGTSHAFRKRANVMIEVKEVTSGRKLISSLS